MDELRTRPDLVVTGGRVVTPAGVRPATVTVTDGRITAVLDVDGGGGGDGGGDGGLPPDVPRVRADGCYVLPGLIDSHVHFRTPGLEHKEDWAHGSRAAVAGGVTTVIDMPNTVPPTLSPEALVAKAELVAGTSLVDYRFHLGADPRRPALLARLDPGIATTAKVFMAGHHTAPTVVRDPIALEKIFAAAAIGGVRLLLHAEDESIFALLDRWQGEPRSYFDYERRRPRSGGISAVARVLELVRRYGTEAHILHLSSAEEADLVTAARAAGLPVTFEVTGHHLSFTDADTRRLGARIRLSPAIRTQADQDRLWEALWAGEVACLGSDHAPHTVEEKTRPVPDAPPGLPGVQELAVAVWTGMRRRRPEEDPDLAVTRLVEHLSARPAEMFKLPGKGRLEPGADADLVVFDPTTPWMLSAHDVRSKCGWSAYEGWTMTGRVLTTIRGGQVAWDAERGAFGRPEGRWLSGVAARDRPRAEAAVRDRPRTEITARDPRHAEAEARDPSRVEAAVGDPSRGAGEREVTSA
ncbi:dihydroorotase [Streptosporangium sandarakinum]